MERITWFAECYIRIDEYIHIVDRQVTIDKIFTKEHVQENTIWRTIYRWRAIFTT